MRKVRAGKADAPPVFGGAPADAATAANSGSATPPQRNVTVIYTSNPAFATPTQKQQMAKMSFASAVAHKLGEIRTAPASTPGVRR